MIISIDDISYPRGERGSLMIRKSKITIGNRERESRISRSVEEPILSPRSAHPPWNLIASIKRETTERLAVWCDARRLIQEHRRQNATAPEWIIQAAMAWSNAAESSLLSCAREHRAFLHAFAPRDYKSRDCEIIASVMHQWGPGDEIRDLALLYWLCRPPVGFFLFFTLSIFISALKSAARKLFSYYLRTCDARQISKQIFHSLSSFWENLREWFWIPDGDARWRDVKYNVISSLARYVTYFVNKFFGAAGWILNRSFSRAFYS